jgi:DSF synthase
MKTSNGRRALEMVRREVEPVTHEELMRIVYIWADAALRLTERNLRMMERLVRAQDRSLDAADDVPTATVPTATVTPLQRIG